MALDWSAPFASGELAADVYGMHEYVMILCLAIFVGVFSYMFWSVYAHRKTKGRATAQFHETTTVEFLWTVIPAIILVIIVLPATRVVIAQKDGARPPVVIKVTGAQWQRGYGGIESLPARSKQ